jgi:hypothetical protein
LDQSGEANTVMVTLENPEMSILPRSGLERKKEGELKDRLINYNST